MLTLYGDVASTRMHHEEVLASAEEERFGGALGLAFASHSYRHTPLW
jgi:hypothetical protein